MTKSKNENPLTIIQNWLNTLPQEFKKELISLCIHFHPDQTIETNYKRQEHVERFFAYLNPEGITNKEAVIRAFAITKLFEFAFEGRDTEGGWQETFDLHLALRSRAQEKGHSTQINDDFLDNYEERKNQWIAMSRQWAQLEQSELTTRKISDWYFFDGK